MGLGLCQEFQQKMYLYGVCTYLSFVSEVTFINDHKLSPPSQQLSFLTSPPVHCLHTHISQLFRHLCQCCCACSNVVSHRVNLP